MSAGAPSPRPEGYPEAAPKGPGVTARVGFVGLGAMGEPMARSLRTGRLRGDGQRASPSRRARAVACRRRRTRPPIRRRRGRGRCDVVILAFPTLRRSKKCSSAARRRRGRATGALVIDMSTISPVAIAPLRGATRRARRRFRRRAGQRRPRSRARRYARRSWPARRPQAYRASRAGIARDGHAAPPRTGRDG